MQQDDTFAVWVPSDAAADATERKGDAPDLDALDRALSSDNPALTKARKKIIQETTDYIEKVLKKLVRATSETEMEHVLQLWTYLESVLVLKAKKKIIVLAANASDGARILKSHPWSSPSLEDEFLVPYTVEGKTVSGLGVVCIKELLLNPHLLRKTETAMQNGDTSLTWTVDDLIKGKSTMDETEGGGTYLWLSTPDSYHQILVENPRLTSKDKGILRTLFQAGRLSSDDLLSFHYIGHTVKFGERYLGRSGHVSKPVSEFCRVLGLVHDRRLYKRYAIARAGKDEPVPYGMAREFVYNLMSDATERRVGVNVNQVDRARHVQLVTPKEVEGMFKQASSLLATGIPLTDPLRANIEDLKRVDPFWKTFDHLVLQPGTAFHILIGRSRSYLFKRFTKKYPIPATARTNPLPVNRTPEDDDALLERREDVADLGIKRPTPAVDLASARRRVQSVYEGREKVQAEQAKGSAAGETSRQVSAARATGAGGGWAASGGPKPVKRAKKSK